VLGAVEGLSDEALRRPVLPSGWSCLGMVQHLTLSVERLWFRAVVAGDPEVIDMVGSQDSAWHALSAVRQASRGARDHHVS
jgi:uncharacterized membrane protein YjdF